MGSWDHQEEPQLPSEIPKMTEGELAFERSWDPVGGDRCVQSTGILSSKGRCLARDSPLLPVSQSATVIDKEDVGLLKAMGMNAYRFSISWTRILPSLQPFVTLIHFDPPQGLEDKYGGFLSANIVKDFRDYAGVCFREFGDRVKHWITINEPYVFSAGGYGIGFLAPGRCSGQCSAGDTAREPYIVCHNQLLAHASAVKLYREKFQGSQKGKIGITLNSNWMIPYSNFKDDDDAMGRALDFLYGWFMDPLTYGDYPFNMRALVGNRLPKFTQKQAQMVNGSFDFIGINYYTSNYIRSASMGNGVNQSFITDSCTNSTMERNGIPIGPKAGSPWLHVYPRGIHDLLLYTKIKYNNPVIYITENGVDDVNNATVSLEEALKDDFRVDYYQRHLYYVQQAIRKGVDVRGYFAWSLVDNFEWSAGYTVRFGMNYVDYKNGLKRYPKTSALWFQKFLRG